MTFHFEYPSLDDGGKLMSLSIKQLCILQEQMYLNYAQLKGNTVFLY